MIVALIAISGCGSSTPSADTGSGATTSSTSVVGPIPTMTEFATRMQTFCADATDELVAAAERLVPPTELAARWPGIIAGLVANADHERAMMVALRAGTPEPERPSGLDDFRHLGLGGTCDDWLEMN